MIGWILGGAAALLVSWFGYKAIRGENPAAALMNFSPFTLASGQFYTLRVLAPTDLDAFVQKMFKPDVAMVGQVVREGSPQRISGPAGQKEFQVYKARLQWKAPDSVFSQASAVKKMEIAMSPGMEGNRALAAALYVASATPPGNEQRLRFFPVGIVDGPSSAGVG